MSHLVIFEVDGQDSYQQFVAIDEALALVERLRNEGNGTARLFRLEEIPLEIKAYYRVEVGGTPAAAVTVPEEPARNARVEPVEPVEAQERPETPEPEPLAVEPITADDPVPDAVAEGDDFAVTSSLGGARRGLFGR